MEKIERIESEFEDLKKQIWYLNNKVIPSLNGGNGTSSESLEEINTKINTLSNSLSSLQEQMKSIPNDLSTQLDNLSNSIANLVLSDEDIETSINSLIENVDNINNLINSMQSSIETNTNCITELQNGYYSSDWEVIYDKESSDETINLGYPDGIKGNNVVTNLPNIHVYKEIRVTAMMYDRCQSLIIPIDLNGKKSTGIFNSMDEQGLTFHQYTVSINYNEPNTFTSGYCVGWRIKSTSSAGGSVIYSKYNNSIYYYTAKIEGRR